MIADRRTLDRLDRAEQALTRAGWTYTEGAEEWRPPLGPRPDPLLDEIDRLRAAAMTKDEMTLEAGISMMEHGIDSPRRTDLIWKIKVFMSGFDLGHRPPIDLIKAMEDAGLKIVHGDAGGPRDG